MSDINRGSGNELVLQDHFLRKQHLQILVNEKINQIRQLEVTAERLKSVELKKIELTVATLGKEIEQLQAELSKDIIDAEVINDKRG